MGRELGQGRIVRGILKEGVLVLVGGGVLGERRGIQERGLGCVAVVQS